MRLRTPETGRKPHITVAGDRILDRYLNGEATKLNPEMPGVVVLLIECALELLRNVPPLRLLLRQPATQCHHVS